MQSATVSVALSCFRPARTSPTSSGGRLEACPTGGADYPARRGRHQPTGDRRGALAREARRVRGRRPGRVLAGRRRLARQRARRGRAGPRAAGGLRQRRRHRRKQRRLCPARSTTWSARPAGRARTAWARTSTCRSRSRRRRPNRRASTACSTSRRRLSSLGKACVVVDAGTAVTLDFCDDKGTFPRRVHRARRVADGELAPRRREAFAEGQTGRRPATPSAATPTARSTAASSTPSAASCGRASSSTP